ncbi:MAG: hypothetical protein V7K38_15875 [Nostoc sp.]
MANYRQMPETVSHKTNIKLSMSIQTIGILSPGDMGQAIAPWMKSLESSLMKQSPTSNVKSENL